MKIASFENREWIDAWRDRRPMTNDEVLVTYFEDGEVKVGTAFYETEQGSKEAWICRMVGWYVVGHGNANVIAWQPFIEPYDPVAADEEERNEVCAANLTEPVTVTIYPE